MLVKARALEAGIKPIIGHVSLSITLRPKLNKDGSESKVCIDLDNALKVTLDALNGVAYVDDSQIVEMYVVKGAAVDGGGLVVSISDANFEAIDFEDETAQMRLMRRFLGGSEC